MENPKEEPKQELERGITITHVSKQRTLEEAADEYALEESKFGLDKVRARINFIKGAKWQEEQDKNKYSEEDMIAFGKSCFYKGFEKAENDDANCYTAFREEIGILVEQFKKK